jgi:hypothetical protein
MELGRLAVSMDLDRGRLCVHRMDGTVRYIKNEEATRFGLTVAVRQDKRIVVETDLSDPIYCRVLNEGKEFSPCR